MSLENLLKTKQLQPHNPSREAAQRLLQAAARNIADARIAEISGETRFDVAYKAIMQCAMIALWANGYRTSTSQPGHHQTAIHTLPKTIGLEQGTVIVLDALRKQRNINDYEGDPIRAGGDLMHQASRATLPSGIYLDSWQPARFGMKRKMKLALEDGLRAALGVLSETGATTGG